MIDIETKGKKIKKLEDAVQSLSGDLVKLRIVNSIFENDTVITIGSLESRIKLLEQQLPHGEIMIDIETKGKKIKKLEDAVQSLSGDLVKLREAFMESNIDVCDKLHTVGLAIAELRKL